MRNFSHSPQVSWVKKISRYAPVLLAIVVFGGLGTTLLLTSHAATPVASLQAENGTVSAAASVLADTTASGSSAVKFGTGSTGGGGGGGTVANGQQINTSNTGYLAWTGPQGQKCTDATMTVYNNEVDASSLGGSSTCAYFKGGINMNANVTLTACKFTSEIDNDTSKTLTLNYCTLNDTSPQDFALGEQNFTATRSQMMGSSDGVRFGGNVNLIEDYIRTKLQSPDDHNDGVQAYLAGSGGSILRCNINVTPVNGDNSTTTGAIFMADDSQGTAEIRDNYLIGGGYTLRLHENMFYRVTGNIIEKNSYAYGPLSTDNSRSGAFLEWSNNKLSDGTALNP